jgi:ABC-type iron transport system FetAB ATPase subunit
MTKDLALLIGPDQPWLSTHRLPRQDRREPAKGHGVDRLSTGERQRLALARALQLGPQVLLLDEPTSALDPPSVRQVEALLAARVEAGCALLLVSHDPDQPNRLGARHMRMDAGRLTAPVEAAP